MLIISPVSAAGCSRKGTDWDFPFSATDTLEFLAGEEKDNTEPMQARIIVARNILDWMFVMLLSSDMARPGVGMQWIFTVASECNIITSSPFAERHWIENLWNFNPSQSNYRIPNVRKFVFVFCAFYYFCFFYQNLKNDPKTRNDSVKITKTRK